MLKDITLGQYFPNTTFIHMLDSRVKLVMTFAFILVLFLCDGLLAYTIAFAVLVLLVKVSQISGKMMIKSLKPIAFIIVFTSILNIFYIQGEPLLSLGFLTISKEGVSTAFFMSVRIIMLISVTSLMTYTTSPIALTDGLESMMNPLKKIKFPVHEFAMMMTIALRFIPTLIEETDKIMSAQKARGADFETGSIFARAKALIPILVPLFVSALRRAEELATAMECRLYQGGQGRTRLKVLKMTINDYIFIMLSFIIFAVMFFVSYKGF